MEDHSKVKIKKHVVVDQFLFIKTKVLNQGSFVLFEFFIVFLNIFSIYVLCYYQRILYDQLIRSIGSIGFIFRFSYEFKTKVFIFIMLQKQLSFFEINICPIGTIFIMQQVHYMKSLLNELHPFLDLIWRSIFLFLIQTLENSSFPNIFEFSGKSSHQID